MNGSGELKEMFHDEQSSLLRKTVKNLFPKGSGRLQLGADWGAVSGNVAGNGFVAMRR